MVNLSVRKERKECPIKGLEECPIKGLEECPNKGLEECSNKENTSTKRAAVKNGFDFGESGGQFFESQRRSTDEFVEKSENIISGRPRRETKREKAARKAEVERSETGSKCTVLVHMQTNKAKYAFVSGALRQMLNLRLNQVRVVLKLYAANAGKHGFFEF
ncbi:hypothetical protein AAG570_006222 [Ranatra chinensis]|uniref:Uncharacterized protein n=1 Tax=Ranatra chinensis TaxID=642074 RepID=A0ABD0YU07_9HEMI